VSPYDNNNGNDLSAQMRSLFDRLEALERDRDALRRENEDLRARLRGSSPTPTPTSNAAAMDHPLPRPPAIAGTPRRGSTPGYTTSRDTIPNRPSHPSSSGPSPTVARYAPPGASPHETMSAATRTRTHENPAPAAGPVPTPVPTHVPASAWFGRGMQPDVQPSVEPTPARRVPRKPVDVGVVNEMDTETLNALPYGLIVLDHEGRILFYSETEERFAGYRREEVMGQNFFADVAPCTRVKEFQGRFREYVAGRLGRVVFFDFVFHFEHGSQEVLIGFSPGRRRGQVNVMLMRRGEAS